MVVLSFLVQVMSGVMLLLFSVNFLRVGLERLWSSQIRGSLQDQSSLGGNLLKGIVLGLAMQGGTVVLLMVAGLAGSGSVPVVSAAIVALGADMGSALAVQFLQLPVSALGPLAILTGATIYLRANRPRLHNMGQVILGLGLLFLSLTIIRSSVSPIGQLHGAGALIGYLSGDVVTAALAGVVLTLLMHSSVAAILTAVAFAATVPIGAMTGIAFVLGCNAGSALLPIWLLAGQNARAKAVAYSVASLRCAVAAILCAALALAGGATKSGSLFPPGQIMLAAHFGFNLLLLVLSPLCVFAARYFEDGLHDTSGPMREILPSDVEGDSGLAQAALKRKVSRMLDIASDLLTELNSDQPDKDMIGALEQRMNAGLEEIRDIYAGLPEQDADGLTDAMRIVEFAIRIERCGDVLSGKYLALMNMHARGEYRFSEDGTTEIAELVDAVRASIILAHETVWTEGASVAQRLVRHKQYVADLENRSRGAHLARLRRGNLTSLGSSNQHLEIIAALKEINSKFATIGYAVLERHGGLRKTRLKSAGGERLT